MDPRALVGFLALMVCACGGEAASNVATSGTTTSRGSPGVGGAVGGSAPSGGSSSAGGVGTAAGGTVATGGASSGGGTAPSGEDVGGRPLPLAACQSDADCVAVRNSGVCTTGYCLDPIPASRDDVTRDPCLTLVDDSESTQACPGASVQCLDPSQCALCNVPRCDAGKCKLELGRSIEACDALGEPCARLQADWRIALEAARACRTDETSDCSLVLTAPCGCPVEANGSKPELVQAAQLASDALAAAGCACGDDVCKSPEVGCSDFCTGGECVPAHCK
jgi:hypothetical protein